MTITDYLHGVEVLEIDDSLRPVTLVKTNVLGFVGTAPLADPEIFPLNKAVYIPGNVRKAALLGMTGTLYDAVKGAYDHLGAGIIVVRVASNANPNIEMSNVIGDPILKTGVYQLEVAAQVTGVKPRMIGAPGFTAVRPQTGISEITMDLNGEGYTTPPRVKISGAGTPVVEAEALGGNAGNGELTLAVTPYGAGVKSGVYEVRCIGGARSANVTEKQGGNTGNGTLGTLSADATAAVGNWRVICGLAGTDAGTFSVLKPNGALDGLAVVGTPYNSANGPTFTITDGSEDFVVGDEFVIAIAATVPANGGLFSVKDPAGASLPDATVGEAYADEVAFTIADGLADFEVGDGFDINVLVPAQGAGFVGRCVLNAEGGVAAVIVECPGLGYNDADSVVFESVDGNGSGAAATLTSGQVANPVTAALVSVASRQRMMAFADGPSTTTDDAIEYAADWDTSRLMIIDPMGLYWENGAAVTKPGSPRAMGLQAYVDATEGPHEVFSNRVVNGCIGVSRPVAYARNDKNSEHNYLNEHRITTIIHEQGYKFFGARTASSDPLWAFMNVRRIADLVAESLEIYGSKYLDKAITRHRIKSVLWGVQSFLDGMVAQEWIVGGKVWFDGDLNDPASLMQGIVTFDFDIEPFAIMEHIIFRMHRNPEYYRGWVEQIVAETSTVTSNSRWT